MAADNPIQNVPVNESSQPNQVATGQEGEDGKINKVGNKRNIIGKLFFHPDAAEVPDATMQQLRDRIHETEEADKIRKQVKQRKRAMKLQRMEAMKHPKHSTARNETNLIQINAGGGLASKSIHSLSAPTPGKAQDTRASNNSNLINAPGPTHIHAFVNDKEEEWQEKRKKISQLYTGLGVYSHALSDLYDTPSESRFYTLLNEERQLKYPISYDIKLKMERIKHKREKNRAKKSSAFSEWIKTKFFQTAFGNVFRVTPRYYKLTPEVPKLCRRCKHPLEDTLEARWTSTGVTFCILFPIIGILCCLANREFVCVVCEEAYVYGDFPSRCKPAETVKHEVVYNLSQRKRSFKHWLNHQQKESRHSQHVKFDEQKS